LTRHTTHIWRLLGWGITLARHGALVGIENDRNTPAPVRRLVTLARWISLTGKGRKPDYAGAFRAIGPAAIKLGQTLATRPDLVGPEAAHNLLALQDKLPPVPLNRPSSARWNRCFPRSKASRSARLRWHRSTVR